MAGGYLKLLATGGADIILTGNPEITHFKSVYHRYHNFAIEPIKHYFKSNIGFGRKIHCEIAPKGHMLHKVFFNFKLPALSIPPGSTYIGWVNNIGHAIINSVEFNINGHNDVKKDYDIYMDINYELTTPHSKRGGLDIAIGKFNLVEDLETNASSITEYIVELDIWFGESLGKALPLVNMISHNIDIIINLKSFQECIVYDGSNAPDNIEILDASIIAEHIYLDEEEVYRFSQQYEFESQTIIDPETGQFTESLIWKLDNEGYKIPITHNYLIDQVQYSEPLTIKDNVISYNADLKTFKFLITELLFVFRETNSENNNDWFNYSIRSNNGKFVDTIKFKINGIDFAKEMSELYYRTIVPAFRHTSTPNKNIYVFPFCKDVENPQPNGALNFSLIDNKDLEFKLNAYNPECNLHVFAKSKNIFQLKGGVAGISFIT